MTAREAVLAAKNISKRKNNEYRFHAKIHGVKFKDSVDEKKAEFDKKKDDFLTAQIEKMNKERFGNVPK